ncbi:amidohydrolase family protein [Singulisphaera sp. Ch08]|uniref:Amidohydrolase family protein n=1 Tax=Singulisphaera sp. Ch08 TaxID=3120278 RepID=A0AAU7CKR0_9BACT
MRTITLEEHFATPAFMNGPGKSHKDGGESMGIPDLVDQLLDLGKRRIADMDAAGIDVQVVSLTAPGVEQLEPGEAASLARETNDVVAEAIRHHPTRLAGFATIPTPDPEAAARELERAIRDLGFKGAAINGHVRGRYLDDSAFAPILERAESLGVPIYLHPTPPPRAVFETYYAGFAPEVSARFSTAGWGWHIETATHVLRMVLGGVFDRHPKLQVIIGHMGEGLPFMMQRLDRRMTTALTKLRRPIGAYLRENLHYTFSGYNFTSTFLDLLLEVGVDRIMFSADYPYSSMDEARRFLEGLPVAPADRERIAHGNAEHLLGLGAS